MMENEFVATGVELPDRIKPEELDPVDTEVIHKELPSQKCRTRNALYGDNVKPYPKECAMGWEGKDYTDIKLKNLP